ncbi:MAG TPA: ABC transporter ATP-binding protein [Anaerolineales bacterium]|nr:ABC transporter ATP-binding protein [Anaerolineales bacterium]
MTTLEVRNLVKKYPGASYPAVNDVSFELANGEILALVGPSGCGKTTTLRLIAGLERPDAGIIRLNDRIVASDSVFVPPEQRGVGMVFQDHALFPHLTVYENVAFGLRGRKPDEIRTTVGEMLHLVGLLSFSKRYPHELSGGERQRVALARALAPRPVLLLMDEPFSSLDADLRADVREHVRGILKAMRATVIFVTHDQEEALYMGDRLAVLQKGYLEQIGTPEEIFHDPRTRFVAEFMGDSDFLSGKVVPGGIQTELGLLPQVVDLPLSTPVEIALRADDVGFQMDGSGNSVIIGRFFRGAFNLYRLRLDSGKILHAFTDHTRIIPVGTRVRAVISAEHPLTVFSYPELTS